MEQKKYFQSLPRQLSPSPMAPEMPHLHPRYKILGLISEDANGPLYWGKCSDDNRKVAIRIFSRKTKPAADQTINFAVTLSQLVATREILTSKNNIPFAVMDLPTGICLEALLSQKGILPVNASLQIALHVSLVVRWLHVHDVVHGHINPQNIFISKAPNGALSIQLVHHVLEGSPATFNFLGNLSPELCAGRVALFESDDLWSIGVLLHRMLLGTAPFGGESQEEICGRIRETPLNLPRAFRRELHQVAGILDIALSKNPSDRFSGINLNLELKSLLAQRRGKPDSVVPLTAKPLRESHRNRQSFNAAVMQNDQRGSDQVNRRASGIVNQKGPTRPMQMWSEPAVAQFKQSAAAIVIDACGDEPSFEELESTTSMSSGGDVTALSASNDIAETRPSIDTRLIAKQEQWKAKKMKIIKRAALLVTKKKNKSTDELIGDIVTVK